MTKERKIQYINMKAHREVVKYEAKTYGCSKSKYIFITSIEEQEGRPFSFCTSNADQKIATELVNLMFEEAMRTREEGMFND